LNSYDIGKLFYSAGKYKSKHRLQKRPYGVHLACECIVVG